MSYGEFFVFLHIFYHRQLPWKPLSAPDFAAQPSCPILRFRLPIDISASHGRHIAVPDAPYDMEVGPD